MLLKSIQQFLVEVSIVLIRQNTVLEFYLMLPLCVSSSIWCLETSDISYLNCAETERAKRNRLLNTM